MDSYLSVQFLVWSVAEYTNGVSILFKQLYGFKSLFLFNNNRTFWTLYVCKQIIKLHSERRAIAAHL